MSDIFISHPYGAFSYRVAGICIRNDHILLQKPTNAVDYALPGGHVQMGEQGAVALAREFREELGVAAAVGELKWVGENFFPWNMRPCHQLCLYYEVTLPEDACTAPVTVSLDRKHGQAFDVEFHWFPLSDLPQTAVYPTDLPQLLEKWNTGIQHFVYTE